MHIRLLIRSVITILMLNFVRSAFKTIQGTSLSPCQAEVLHLALLYAIGEASNKH